LRTEETRTAKTLRQSGVDVSCVRLTTHQQTTTHTTITTDTTTITTTTLANISESFTHKMAAKTSWNRCESKLRHYHAIWGGSVAEWLACQTQAQKVQIAAKLRFEISPHH